MPLFNAGNAYLQILPSFKGIDALMQRETAKLSRAIDQSIAKGASDGLVKAFKDFDASKVTKSGKDSGDKWVSSFESTLSARIKQIADDLPEFEPKANLSKFDRAIAQSKKALLELSSKNIGPTGDIGLDQVGTKLDAVIGRMVKLANETKNADQRMRLLNTAVQAESLKGLVDDARAQGLTDGRAYGGAFAAGAKERIAAALKTLPEVNLDADASPAERAIAALRVQLEELGSKKIGVDIDRDRFAEELSYVTGQIESLARDPHSITLKYDLDKAAKQLSDFTKTVGESTKQSMEADGEQAAEQWAGAWTTTVQKRLQNAIRQIPSVPMTVDNSDAERKLAAIRVSLEELSGKTIGVDVSADEALAKIDALKARLAKLDGDDVSIDVKVNAAKAAAELEVISQEARNASDSVGGIGTSAGISISRLGYLVAIGASIGSLIAPAAATAAVGIAGIGTAALAALSGFGVLALGLSGVSDAVKKIDAYQQDANKSAKSFAQSQNQIISAVQAVSDAERNLGYTRQDVAEGATQAQRRIGDAERSLANTRRDAADAAVAAQQRIADAERNVTKAQRDAASSVRQAREQEANAVRDLTRAHQDAVDSVAQAVQSETDAERSATQAVRDQKEAREALSQALKDAAKDLRDLQLDVKKNQNDIDEATTAAMKAKQELDKIMSNPRASEIERRQALETYQDKLLQIEGLKNKQSDLSEQEKKAAQDGVEGTEKVKKARQGVADADQRAADAERKVGEARKAVDKARLEASQKIADAQQRVSDSQIALQKAQTDGAERVADAQRQVADAQKSAAKQQRDSQQQLLAATEAVAGAQRDAVKQQRDGQRQILSGTEAVTNAQRQLAMANMAAGTAGGDAFDSMNDALNQLAPAGQNFAKWLYSLKPKLQELRQTAEEGFLPALQQSIQTLVDSYFPAFNQFVGKIAAGLGTIFRATSMLLLTPEWRAFFSYVNQTALPALEGMWVAAANIATGMVNLYRALAPMAKPMGQGLIDLSEKFQKWSEQLQHSNGFKQFTDYVAANGPKVVDLLGQLAEVVVRIVIAAAPLGAVVLNLVDGFTRLINSIPLPVLSGLVDVVSILGGGILVLTTLVNGVKLATEVWGNAARVAAKAQEIAAAAVDLFKSKTVGAVTSTGLLNTALLETQGAGKAAAGGMAAMEAASGPLGIALLAIGGLWLLMSSSQDKAKEATDELAGALKDLGKAYQEAAATSTLGGSAIEESFRRIVASNEDLQKAVIALNNVGLSVDDIAGAAAGSAESYGKVIDVLNSKVQLLQDQYDKLANRGPHVNANDVQAVKDQLNVMKDMRDRFQETADKAKTEADAMNILTEATQGTTAATSLLTPIEQALSDAQKTLADSTSTAQQKMDSLTKVQDLMRQSTINAIDADEQYHSTTSQLTDAVKSAKEAHDANYRSLELTNATGLRNRDTLESLIESANKMYDADVALNGVTQDAVRKGSDHIQKIRDTAKALGLNKDQTDALIQAYSKIPSNIETAIGFKEGQFDQMFQQLEQAAFIQRGLARGEDIDKVKADYRQTVSDRNRAHAHGWATGGPIAGPGIVGGPTEDANLIWASKGEYMHQAAAVDYYGVGVMDALNRRAIPREAFPGFAAGGFIGAGTSKVPFKIDLSKTFIPDQDYLLTHANIPAAGEDSFSGVLSPNATAKTMQEFALKQRGKRYLWSAVGPDTYDCSGLVGDLWAIATGHSLYQRYMSTGDMGPGRHGMVAGPGKLWTVYLGPGHTASNIDGLHAEAYGGNGTPLAIGHVGTRLSYYNQKLHLPGFAQGGLVDNADLNTRAGRIQSFLRTGWPEPPRGMSMQNMLEAVSGATYDTGGMVPPGYSMVFNGTGKPEPVLNPQQWQQISQLVQGSNTGTGSTYNFEFRDTTLDPGKLRALQDREAILSRQGRAR